MGKRLRVPYEISNHTIQPGRPGYEPIPTLAQQKEHDQRANECLNKLLPEGTNLTKFLDGCEELAIEDRENKERASRETISADDATE